MFVRKYLVPLTLLVWFATTPTAQANFKLHPLFTDNAVLQQGQVIPVWGTCDEDEKITVTLGDQSSDARIVGKQWVAFLKGPGAGGPFELKAQGKSIFHLCKNVMVGEVWVCSGQSNMEMSVNQSYEPEKTKKNSPNPNIRLFTVKKRTATAPIADQNDLGNFTKWDECGPDTVGTFSAVAYSFGANLQKNLPNNTPIGLIHTSWGGTPAEAWTSKESLDSVPELKYYNDRAKKTATDVEDSKKAVGPNTPSSLYNAMLYPVMPYAIRGAIWYQGESNAGRAYEYKTLFTTMITDWRKNRDRRSEPLFKDSPYPPPDFPFYAVQLAPWHANDADGVTWPELREAQTLATKTLKNVGMAVTTDVGDLLDIHPKDKLTVGNRLAIAARAQTYGQKIAGSGPTYKEMQIDGQKITLSFDNVGGGLVKKYGAVNGFTICGEDRYFYPANAALMEKDNTIVVYSDKVPKPVAVRFGWKNYPVLNLYNKDGLPAVPFRTDNFPWTTAPNK